MTNENDANDILLLEGGEALETFVRRCLSESVQDKWQKFAISQGAILIPEGYELTDTNPTRGWPDEAFFA
jgi:hypothetical protein